jgi:general secretion pathway protein B
MSYILDALRRADAQRERDPARGIHAQPVTLAAPEEYSVSTSRLGLVVGAFVVGAALLAVAMWWFGWLVLPAAPPGAASVVMAPVPLPKVVAVPAVNASASASVSAAAPATELLPAAPPSPPPVTLPVREVPKAGPVVTAYPPATAYPPPAATSPARLLSLAELPADVQRELPKLAISGGVYSPTPAQRLLIVNGMVLNEGAEAAPGVLLEQIRPRVAVLNFRGYRYGMPY